MNKMWIFLAVVMALSSISVAAVPNNSPLSSVTRAVGSLCRGLRDILPVAAMLMVVIAGVIYAAGQVMGAETRDHQTSICQIIGMCRYRLKVNLVI